MMATTSLSGLDCGARSGFTGAGYWNGGKDWEEVVRMLEDKLETFVKPSYISEFRHQEQFKVYKKKNCSTAPENPILILFP